MEKKYKNWKFDKLINVETVMDDLLALSIKVSINLADNCLFLILF